MTEMEHKTRINKYVTVLVDFSVHAKEIIDLLIFFYSFASKVDDQKYLNYFF